jgi:hypothetical protein
MWGTALVVHALAFSFAHGVFHPYYTVTMAPIVAALAGAGFVELWRLAAEGVSWPLAATVAVTGWWGVMLLGRTPEFVPWLRTAVAVAAVGAAAVILVMRSIRRTAVAAAAAALGIVAVLAGPAAYALDSLGTSYAGGDPKAGPDAGRPPPTALAAPNRPQDAGAAPGPLPPPEAPPDRRPIDGPLPPGAGDRPAAPDAPPGADRPPGGNPGGPEPDLEAGLVEYLVANRSGETWLAAVSNAHISAPLMLETGEPVLTAGGFGGRDPALTVDALAAYVAEGDLRFVIATDGTGVGPGRNDQAGRLARWLEHGCDAVHPGEYGGTDRSAITLYDCAEAA